MSRIVTYETEPGAGLTAAAGGAGAPRGAGVPAPAGGSDHVASPGMVAGAGTAAPTNGVSSEGLSGPAAGIDEETPLLVLGGPARRSMGHLAGRTSGDLAVMSVEASSELVRLTRVIVSAMTVRGNGSIAAMIEALEREEAKPEKGFSSPLQEAVFLLLLRPRILRIRPSKRHLGPLMQDLAKRLQSLLGMKLTPPRVIVLSPTNGHAPAPAESDEDEEDVSVERRQIGPRDIYREVLARVRAALAGRAASAA